MDGSWVDDHRGTFHADALAVARARQENKEGYATRRRDG